MTHPLLRSAHCPFNLLRSFKEGAHRSKTDFIIVSDTHALRVRVLDPRKHIFLLKDQFMRVCMRPRQRSKNMRENTICRFQRLFRHACMLIRTRKRMRALQEDAISFTSIGALFKRCVANKSDSVQMLKVDASHQYDLV